MSIQSIVNNQQNIAENFTDTSDPQPILKKGFEEATVEVTSDKIYTRDVSEEPIWDRETSFEEWDNADAEWGSDTYNNGLVLVETLK